MLAYLGTIFFFEADSVSLARYKIDADQLRWLSLTIVVPGFAIYFAAFSSFLNIGSYAHKIKKSPDGAGFTFLTKGLMVLGISLPANALISRLLSYGVQEGNVSQAAATIITTHLSAATYFASFCLLYLGSRRLLASLKGVTIPQRHIVTAAVGIALLSIPYVIVTLLNPARTTVVPPAMTATYYMPDILIFLTIIVPYIVTWTLGFYASLYLYHYHKNVGGAIYKKALRKLNIGFFIVILTTVLLQFISAASTVISGWALGVVLTVIYLLLGTIAVGYVYIALGAKRLAKLEEIT